MSQTDDVRVFDEEPKLSLDDDERDWLDEQLERYEDLLQYLHDH